jgi:uncharacterized protein
MIAKRGAFLTAEWRHLVMLNYAIDPAVLKPLTPLGTELDAYEGKFFVSVVGFLFLNTKVFGCGLPFHRNFEEVNLRFYVRRYTSAGWRRGVVFVRELVPRLAIATVARTVYGEPYRALPMRHRIERSAWGIDAEYGWYRGGRWEGIRAKAQGEPSFMQPGSSEEFIAEHYWGYTARPGGCSEYEVEHPPWRIWKTAEASLDADVEALYGKAFVESLSARPAGAFIAEGSSIVVCRATRKNQQCASAFL